MLRNENLTATPESEIKLMMNQLPQSNASIQKVVKQAAVRRHSHKKTTNCRETFAMVRF